MIPKIIHYCWFGGKPLPPLALECIASWRKYLPEYKIIQWREAPLDDNETLRYETDCVLRNGCAYENGEADEVRYFDVNSIPYTAEAYRQKKYAFVSDYCRFVAMYEYGGIYFDTDVEVIRPMDELLRRLPQISQINTDVHTTNTSTKDLCTSVESVGVSTHEHYGFMGFEQNPDGENTPGRYAPRYCFSVALGLGFGMTPRHPFMKKMLDYYQNLIFELPPADITWYKTIVAYTTEMLMNEKAPLAPLLSPQEKAPLLSPQGGKPRLLHPLEWLKSWLYPPKYTEVQVVGDGIHVYPSEYFAPINVVSGRLHITENTYTIHRYMGSWNSSKRLTLKGLIRSILPEWVFFLNNRIKRRRYSV